MRILFLDIASHSGLLACVTDERVVASRAIDHRMGDHELVLLVEEVVKEAGWALLTLTHLACVIGPGGFTSLRVGVSLINALAWGLKIPVAGIHLSELYAARMKNVKCKMKDGVVANGTTTYNLQPTTSSLWLHSTKRTELFLRGFGPWAKVWPSPVHISLDDFLNKLSPTTYNLQPTTYVGELLPDHRAAIEKAGLRAAEVAPITDVLPSFLVAQKYRDNIIQPWYGRGW